MEVPEPPKTLAGLSEQVRPVNGDTLAVKATVALNPSSGATVIVEVPAVPDVVGTVVGLAVRVKSCTTTDTVAAWLRDPLVPVTVTVYAQKTPVQDSVDVWDAPKVMLVSDSVHVSPVGGETAEVKATVPVNPLTGATVIVEMAATPAFTVRLVGLAVTEKSVTLTVTVAETERLPLAPVTMTVKVPDVVPVHDKLLVPDVPRVTLADESVQAIPVVGEAVAVRATVPVKLFTEVTVIVEVAAVPTATVALVGLATTVKVGAPPTVYVTVAECDSEPLVPVTVTVRLPVAELDAVHDRVLVPDVVVVLSATEDGLSEQVNPD